MASRVCLKCRCTQILPSFKRNLATGYLQSGQFCTFLLGFNRRHIQWSTRNNAVVNQGLPVFSKNVGAMKKDQHRQSFSHQTRSYSSSQHIPHIPEQLPSDVDPFKLVEKEVSLLTDDIRKELYNSAGSGDILEPAQYHFDGKGKSLRPMVVLLAAKACNIHEGINSILPSQQKIGMVAEMIHTASLVHDDVIDASDTRRGKPSVFKLWGQRKAILTGDFILSVSSQVLARIGNKEVVGVMSLILDDLVRGEFMQLGSKEDEEKRFNHYLKKTYKKTASLIANSCKSVAILSNCSDEIVEVLYNYGKHAGIAFQLIDDLLDFISNEELLGKPAAADLKLGLATAPVLFASQQYPELHAMIMRRFSEPGDVEKAWQLVNKSDGLEHTRSMARQHCKEAVFQINKLKDSVERRGLVAVTEKILSRQK